ncbi:MAG: hypothetical protein D8H96_18940, partial [Lautropia sp.]
MFALLIIPVLVAGFLACHIHPVHSYKLHRYEGQYLYLKSAELGLACLALAGMLAMLGHWLLPSELAVGHWHIGLEWPSALAEMLQNSAGMERSSGLQASWLILLSGMTCLSAWLLKVLGHLHLCLRFRTWDTHIFIIQDILEDSPLDDLLFRLSLQQDKYAMLMMDDRKVYVGKIISLGEPSETAGMDQDISIMPLMSGYRDKDTLRVNFTTDYAQVGANIYVSLRQEQIVSATEFNFEAYQTWQ